MRKYLLILLGSVVVFLCWAKPDFIYRYWFDNNDADMVQGVATGDRAHVDADVSALAESTHVLHLQVFDGDTPGAVTSHMFIVSPTVNDAGYAELRYWFDNDHSTVRTINSYGTTVDIDVSDLSEGLHTICVQTGGNAPSPVRTSMFIKLPQVVGVDYITCVSYIDGVMYRSDSVDPNSGVIHYDMPIADIAQGLHLLTVQLVSATGGTSELKSCYFLRHPTGNEISRMRCFYGVDGYSGMTEASVFDNGDFHFDVDVASVSDGLHSITYMLVQEDGSVTDMKSGMFYKIPLGGYGFTSYWYWINDKDDEAVRVDIEGLPEQLRLTELLPVASQPFRSSQFHFEYDKSGVPYVYASNDFHFRIFSNDGRFVESCKTYTDYSVPRKVSNVTVLKKPSDRVRRSAPAPNDIVWFSIDAEIGDSLAIYAGNAATLQVFDPHGAEVYSVQGFDAIENGGFHTMEEGTYYIAMHDVAWNFQSIVDLVYEHINKYAVLDYTPKSAGVVPGYIHIDLLGNGYEKLTNAILRKGSTELWCNELQVTDYAHACLEFNIPNADIARGQYDLTLEFEDNGVVEAITVPKAFVMADPQYGHINVDVRAPQTTGRVYHAFVTVTNTGNVEYDGVPLYFAYDNPDYMTRISFNNFSVLTSQESIDNGLEVFYRTDSIFGQERSAVFIPTIIPMLKANESQTYDLEFESGFGTVFNFFAWAYRPWSIKTGGKGSGLNTNGGSGGGSGGGTGGGSTGGGNSGGGSGGGNPGGDGGSGSIGDDMGDSMDDLCYIDPCGVAGVVGGPGSALAECMCSIALGIGETLAGIHNGLHWMTYSAGKAEYERETGQKLDSPAPRRNLMSPGDIISNVMDHCIPGPFDDLLGGLVGRARALAGLLTPNNNCPDPPSTPLQPRRPVDPNDILGYEAPSGSRYIKRGLTDLSYTIEFENDSTQADAAAHHIVIRNQLDASRFDLASFKPRLMNISDLMVEFDGSQNFVTTVDMRPDINVLAQVTLEFDASTGLAVWDIQALDPMTLEPTDHYMQGILPVNDADGHGMGDIVYDISLKEGLADGTSITNSASIVFDDQQPIETPVWENIIDSVDPVSHVSRAVAVSVDDVMLTIEGDDTRSGIWQYDIYSRTPGDEHWRLVAEGVTTDDDRRVTLTLEPCEGTEFCAVAYDRAGNVESKELHCEATLGSSLLGDANSDGAVDIQDAVLIVQFFIEAPGTSLNALAADYNMDGLIDMQDAVGIVNKYVTTDSNMRHIRKRLNIK